VNEIEVADAVDRRNGRARAGVEHDLIGQERLAIGNDPEPPALAAIEPAVPRDQPRILFPGEAALGRSALRVDDVPGAPDDGAEVDVRYCPVARRRMGNLKLGWALF